MEKIYTCEEVAERYGVSLYTVWKWIRNKKLGGFKVGRLYRIKQSDLVKFEEANKKA